jgi:hypothetical protein
MAVTISLQGNSVGDGFLLAPVGSTYDAELSLATDAGTLAATLQASPNPAGLVFSQTSVNLSTSPTSVTVHATVQSASRGDTTIQVLDGAVVVASFVVTAIKHPAVNFSGRFEARFATDNAPYNSNPLYTAMTPTNVNIGNGWTWGLEGEPDFTNGVVPENLETAVVGRVVRLNDPVALRSHAAPIVSTAVSITGKTTSGDETFTTGDPIFGQPANFGPNTYLAGNNPQAPGDPAPEEFWSAGFEPMGLFELHFGTMFSGASKIGAFVAKAAAQNQQTRNPDSRPIASGLANAAAERAELGLPTLQAFSDARIDELVADYTALPGGPSVDRRNLARRIGHLLASASGAKSAAVQAAHPGEFSFLIGTLPVGWTGKEIYQGKVDANLVFSPGTSAVVRYLSEFASFNITWIPFSLHSDELCGYHKGSLTHLNADGSYSGDPHTRTVNGVPYDFQGVGEFTLLRDGQRMEVQVRQWPIAAATPVTDGHTGLTSCVSLINAVAARLGPHRISLQPGRERGQLEFYVDGKHTPLPKQGINLGPHRVSIFDAGDGTGLRADYADGTVLLVTAHFWTNHQVWYLDVSITNTSADEGIMGVVPRDSWLPRLRDGTSVGALPSSLHTRYITLYKKFADSWRVTDKTSLFTYAPGTTTKTFTDPDWPAEKPPCKLKPEFVIPNTKPLRGMPVERARAVCAGVKAGDLNANCIFDVATTGDPIFAKSYALAQELRERGTVVMVTASPAPGRPDRSLGMADIVPEDDTKRVVLQANVASLFAGARDPSGNVTFIVDGVALRSPVLLNDRGRASITVSLKPGKHEIGATYTGGGRNDHHASSTPTILYEVQQ